MKVAALRAKIASNVPTLTLTLIASNVPTSRVRVRDPGMPAICAMWHWPGAHLCRWQVDSSELEQERAKLKMQMDRSARLEERVKELEAQLAGKGETDPSMIVWGAKVPLRTQCTALRLALSLTAHGLRRRNCHRGTLPLQQRGRMLGPGSIPTATWRNPCHLLVPWPRARASRQSRLTLPSTNMCTVRAGGPANMPRRSPMNAPGLDDPIYWSALPAWSWCVCMAGTWPRCTPRVPMPKLNALGTELPVRMWIGL